MLQVTQIFSHRKDKKYFTVAAVIENISDKVLAERRKNFIPKKKKLNSKWLAQYRTLVTNASKGAVLEAEF
jgi:dihydroxyacid dehydratase/phosphogluconate dehydratase